MRLAAAGAVALWAGLTLLLSEVRWFSRAPLADRLSRYAPGSAWRPARRASPGTNLREVLAPVAQGLGDRLSALAGVAEDAGTRLERVHAGIDVSAFRLQQLGWGVAALAAAAVLVGGVRPGPVASLVLLAAAPAVAFLAAEQRLAARSAAWQRRLVLELPIVSEQLAMLFGAGYSLGAALTRLADRGHGACTSDLRRVLLRMRQGLGEHEALAEWARLARVPAVDRLVAVLALNREAGDLGRLVSAEARAARADVQRRMVEVMDRRAQQVWVPVTVATLVPGAIFLAIPFVEALRLFSGS